MLKTIVLPQGFITNKKLVANKVGGIKGGNKLIKKFAKLLKIRKLLKNLKLLKIRKLTKSKKKLSKSKNSLKFDNKKTNQVF